MRRLAQKLDELVASLSQLEADWADDVSRTAIASLRTFTIKPSYVAADVKTLLSENFENGLLLCRLFLGLSNDEMKTTLDELLGIGGTGRTRFEKDTSRYIAALVELGILDAMKGMVNDPVDWSHVLIERLRSSRGRAIRGQRRGRGLEDFTEQIIKSIFKTYECRCQFKGAKGETAKCDFAIPSRANPLILIESKAYGATGSKMTDIIGDLNIIISNKRHDTSLLFVTDGVTWKRRMADFKKIVSMQNHGQISRIYTKAMEENLRKDLIIHKKEYGL